VSPPDGPASGKHPPLGVRGPVAGGRGAWPGFRGPSPDGSGSSAEGGGTCPEGSRQSPEDGGTSREFRGRFAERRRGFLAGHGSCFSHGRLRRDAGCLRDRRRFGTWLCTVVVRGDVAPLHGERPATQRSWPTASPGYRRRALSRSRPSVQRTGAPSFFPARYESKSTGRPQGGRCNPRSPRGFA